MVQLSEPYLWSPDPPNLRPRWPWIQTSQGQCTGKGACSAFAILAFWALHLACLRSASYCPDDRSGMALFLFGPTLLIGVVYWIGAFVSWLRLMWVDRLPLRSPWVVLGAILLAPGVSYAVWLFM